ncbi:MAG: T9SS type A sorting domain-containing protein [Chitinophagaceae bacterium]|nr:T9SS type A sorting domain-containing protein [Chitinophagaceae bacterium]
MKQRILLFFVMTAFITTLQAQQNDKAAKPITGYAITAIEKGGKSWKEVRLVDIAAGTVVKNIYDSKQETAPLNARTGKAVAVKDDKSAGKTYTATITTPVSDKKVVNLDQELDKANGNRVTYTRTVVIREAVVGNKPFSTSSAAMAYDKKHERLYYTPMSINQLRYIDLKSGNVYYFEDEAFGVVKGMGDVQNQITRMVIASDGNGYALTNDGNHLIRFTTGKNPTITDLGALTDAAETKFSVHSSGGYGGDMVADAQGNLYLLTANRNVFKVNIESKVATHLGKITGLPQGFSTNGAMVEEGSKVIIASSESTVGYYRFDLNTLVAEKVSGSPDVFNASDLANGVLAFDKQKKEKKKKNEEPEETKPEVKPTVADVTARTEGQEGLTKNGIAIYPNPVTNGIVNLSFSEQPAGKYQVQLLDMSGRLISTKEININSSSQIESFKFPELSVSGSYLLKVSSELNKISVTNKIVVQ